jgi:cytochrome c-type protein NapC
MNVGLLRQSHRLPAKSQEQGGMGDMPLSAVWRWLSKPSARRSAGALLFIGFASGILFWGGLHTAVEWSSSLEFCISCHEMETTVYQEYRNTVHYRNASGVRATCADCHVPKAWGPKMSRKLRASVHELPHKILGTIDTPEKFEAHRLEMAERVWAAMKANNSRECRNCHDINTMVLADQQTRARTQHQDSLNTGETCIDCHQGVAHTKPRKEGEEEEGGFTLGGLDRQGNVLHVERGAS